MRIVKTIVISSLGLGIMMGVVLIVYPILFPLSLIVGYKEILKIHLPSNVICVRQELDAFGRERTHYNYRILLQGEPKDLTDFVLKLGLQKGRVDQVGNLIVMKSDRLKWWQPPSQSGKEPEMFLFHRTGEFVDLKSRFTETQAELSGHQLYLFRRGNIGSLQETIGWRGWMF